MNLPVALFKPSIVRAINDQIEDYELHVASMVTSNDQVEDQEETQNSLEVFDQYKQGKNKYTTNEKQKEEQLNETENDMDKKVKGSSELRTLIKVSVNSIIIIIMIMYLYIKNILFTVSWILLWVIKHLLINLNGISIVDIIHPNDLLKF